MPKRLAEGTVTRAAHDGSAEFERLLDTRAVSPAASPKPSWSGVVIGTLVAFQNQGATPYVTFPGQPDASPVVARTTLDLEATHIGQSVVLMFEHQDPTRPIVLGLVRTNDASALAPADGVQVEADGQRLVVTAERGLVLRCGKASITLTPDGKVAVRGTQIVTHATGLNRIRGAAVQIN